MFNSSSYENHAKNKIILKHGKFINQFELNMLDFSRLKYERFLTQEGNDFVASTKCFVDVAN